MPYIRLSYVIKSYETLILSNCIRLSLRLMINSKEREECQASCRILIFVIMSESDIILFNPKSSHLEYMLSRILLSSTRKLQIESERG